MSKGAVAAASGVGLTGIAAAGAYAMGAFGDVSIIPHTLQEFKEKEGINCVDNYFPNLSLSSLDNSSNPKNTNSKEITTSNSLETNFFTFTPSRYLTPQSCLIVNWDKRSSEGGNTKWWGNFRWLWTFVNGDQGIVMFNSLESNVIESKLNIFGGIYFLQKDKNRKWSVHKYKELKSSVDSFITASDFDQKFPKVGLGIAAGDKNKFGDNKDYWGFVSGSADLSSSCSNSGDNACNTLNNHKWFRGWWEWVPDSSSTHKPTDWASQLDTWLIKIYSDISNFKSCLSNCFSNMKGKWIGKTLSGTGID